MIFQAGKKIEFVHIFRLLTVYKLPLLLLQVTERKMAVQPVLLKPAGRAQGSQGPLLARAPEPLEA